MHSPEITLFLWINAGPHTPAAVVLLAQYVTHYLPGLAVAALIVSAAARPALRKALAQTLLSMLLAWMTARLGVSSSQASSSLRSSRGAGCCSAFISRWT